MASREPQQRVLAASRWDQHSGHHYVPVLLGKSKELPVRLSFICITYEATAVVGAFLAFGFLHIYTDSGTGRWHYLFALEGLITGVIGIFAAFYMPPSPTQTAGGFWGRAAGSQSSAVYIRQENGTMRC